MTRLARVPVNPVLARELKERMRGWRAWIVLTAYLLILGAILYLVYEGRSGSPADPFRGPVATQVASVGRSMFEWLVFFMMLLVLFLVPGLTSGAIAGERERQTLVPLQVTLLRPLSILVGKIAASLAFVALLVVATLPLLSVAYLVGGVTVTDIVRAVGAVLLTGVALACLTAACSTFMRRVQSATVLAYAVVLVLTLGTFLAWAAAGLIDRSRGIDAADPPVGILVANPLVAAADILGERGFAVDSPFDPIKELLDRGNGGQVFREGEVIFADGPRPPPMVAEAFGSSEVPIAFDEFGNPIFAAEDGFPVWARTSLVLGGLSVAGVGLASRRLRAPARRER